MTDMSARKLTVFGPGFMLAILMATFAAFAQDGTEEDELEPAVDTSADLEPAVDTSQSIDDERDAAEPAVSTAVIAADVASGPNLATRCACRPCLDMREHWPAAPRSC